MFIIWYVVLEFVPGSENGMVYLNVFEDFLEGRKC